MRPLTPIELVMGVTAGFSVWLLALSAVGFSIAASWPSTRRRGLSTIAMCLWCSLAGYTLSSANWCWMAETDLEWAHAQLRRLPPDARAGDVKLQHMGMLIFYIHLHRWGRRILYSTVVVPLLLSVLAWRKAQGSESPKRISKADEIDALFRDQGG